MISGLRGATYEDKCRELDLDTLEVRRTKQDLCLANKLIHSEDKTYSQELFKFAGCESIRTTRATADPLNIRIERSRLEVRKNAYSTRVAGVWNTLDPETKALDKMPRFKNAIKSHFTGAR